MIALQKFVERIEGDRRPLRSEIYSELGVVIEQQCELHRNNLLPRRAQEILVELLKKEFLSEASSIGTYKTCAALIEKIVTKKLLRDDVFCRLAPPLLAAASETMSAYERSFFGASLEEFREEQTELQGSTLVNMLLRIEFYGDPRLNRAGHLIMFQILDAAYPSAQKEDGTEVIQPLWNKEVADIASEPYVGLVDRFHEVAALMRMVPWSGLAERDLNKENCKQLVALLEIVLEEINHPNFTWPDNLNERKEIFLSEYLPAATQPIARPAFYDAEF
ncbi:MAG: hypothetical protein CFE29_28400 [Bradyrhizobiaceae bacterium PARB1]|nr:MAG: hypothetical protein CFE29_28400 [Bradyrhizobiaceae bacterium PARB1]